MSYDQQYFQHVGFKMSEQKNKVVTYIVSIGQGSDSVVNEDVEKALQEGYTVVDVISTGGSSGGNDSLVAITVVMSNSPEARYNFRT